MARLSCVVAFVSSNVAWLSLCETRLNANEISLSIRLRFDSLRCLRAARVDVRTIQGMGMCREKEREGEETVEMGGYGDAWRRVLADDGFL